MSYAPADASVTGVEVISFERLRKLNDRGTQRADFAVIAIVSEGVGAVSIDFERHAIAPRCVVWIPAGAVHRWDEIDETEGDLVLFVPTATVGEPSREALAAAWLPASWALPEEQRPYVSAALRHLELEARAPVVPAGVPALLLSTLLLRLAPPPALPGAATVRGDLFAAFRDRVEAEYHRFHDASHYAAALGYAPRTLSRAVHDATGLTAKQYLTERIVLEAKRLLAHDRYSASRCATELGFSDASRFSAFFRGAVGEPPGAWQQRHIRR